jgi:hypothetical protein
LRQNFELRFAAAPKQPTSLTAAAGCNQHGAGPLAAQPTQESRTFPRIAEIIESQFKRPGDLKATTHLRNHLARRFGRDYPANAIFSERSRQGESPLQNLNLMAYHEGNQCVKRGTGFS